MVFCSPGVGTEAVPVMISIWFFIGISLAGNGALILAAGLYQYRDTKINLGPRATYYHGCFDKDVRQCK